MSWFCKNCKCSNPDFYEVCANCNYDKEGRNSTLLLIITSLIIIITLTCCVVYQFKYSEPIKNTPTTMER